MLLPHNLLSFPVVFYKKVQNTLPMMKAPSSLACMAWWSVSSVLTLAWPLVSSTITSLAQCLPPPAVLLHLSLLHWNYDNIQELCFISPLVFCKIIIVGQIMTNCVVDDFLDTVVTCAFTLAYALCKLKFTFIFQNIELCLASIAIL